MIFGDKNVFAVEAMLEPGPESGPVVGNNVAGRIRVWLRGRSVGRFEEPLCVIGCLHSELVDKVADLEDLWHPCLDGLSAVQAFDRLDALYYGAHRGRCLPDAEVGATHPDLTLRQSAYRFAFLNSSEAFDGWKAFLLHPPGAELIAVVAEDPTVVEAYHVPVEAFRNAIATFSLWLAEQERRLLPERD